MRYYFLGLTALALAVGLSACATITRGTTTKFTIHSDPTGAHASMSNGFVCESTPCTIRMPRKVYFYFFYKFTVTVSKAGFKPASLDIKPKVAENGGVAFVGNALIGGVIGAGVDVASGAMDDLNPNPAYVTLEPDTAGAPSVAPQGAGSPAIAPTSTPPAIPATGATPPSATLPQNSGAPTSVAPIPPSAKP